MTQARKEPIPLAKQEITLDEASSFLFNHYQSSVTKLEALKGGKHSKAFSYNYSGVDFIIRFNPDDNGFKKDNHLSTNVPIPEVLEIGTYKDLFYCITRKIIGETARDQYNREDFSSLSLLYNAVENIAKVKIAGTGYGYVDINGNAPYKSSLEYINDVYHSNSLFDWQKIFKIAFVDKDFTDYVAGRMEYFARFATEDRELLHGDFGADNVFVNNGAISGIIDWEKMRCGDHFLDVGRVLLFCPNRKATTEAAIKFYKNSDIRNWKERALMGIYHVVLTNYAYAALGGNEISCKSSATRLKELELGLDWFSKLL